MGSQRRISRIIPARSNLKRTLCLVLIASSCLDTRLVTSKVFSSPKPERFLDALEKHPNLDPPLVALCANYEAGEWRYRQLALHLIKWLPEFALNWSDRDSFDSATGVAQLARAAKLVYTTDLYDRRGEFGELLLHAVMRHEFKTEPAIAKLFFKDARNDTVKGFDAVHVVETDQGELELWLGEVKFYNDISAAMSAVVKELKGHTARAYLKDEFALITNKLDPAWPLTERLQKLLDYENLPLDDIFARVRIPVLLTYDSDAVAAHTSRTDEYATVFRSEVLDVRERFSKNDLPKDFAIHLILVPLKEKATLLEELNRRLKNIQEGLDL